MTMAMKYGNNKLKLGKRRTRRNFVVRKRNAAPYGIELHVRGVK